MISILVTAAHEANTIARAITSLVQQSAAFEAEVIVICPDQATADAAQAVGAVKVLQDQQQGKPAALNLGFQHAKGELIVMTDGDVYISDAALQHLLTPFADAKVGAVSGRPISTSPRRTLLGYWSHLLTDAGAHAERLKRDGTFFVCSGYLYAVRKSLINPLPQDALAEDAVLSHMVGNQGYQIRYAPTAEVYVSYPTTYADWLRQKVRSAGGYAQPVITNSSLQMRSFRHETQGASRALAYANTPKEFLWTLLLFAARLHLWLLIFWRVRVQKTPLTQLWQRVETTKG